MDNLRELKLMSTTEEGTQKLYEAFMSLNVVSAACTSIINTKLDAPLKPTSWFEELQKEFQQSKEEAEVWLNDTMINIQYEIPQCIIEYAEEYIETSNFINEILENNPNMQKGDEVFNEVMDKLTSLSSFLSNILDNKMKQVLRLIVETEDTFRNIGSEMQATILKAQQDEISIKGEIDKLNSDITNLKNMIQKENEEIAKDTGSKGEISMTASGAVIFVVNPILGGIIAGIGALFSKKKKSRIKELEKDINNQLSIIQKDQQLINEEQRLLASLKAIEMSTDNTITSIEKADKAVNDIQTIWMAFINILEGVIQDLIKAEESPIAILKKVFTEAALNQWEDLYKFAQDLSDTKVKCIQGTVNLSSVSLI